MPGHREAAPVRSRTMVDGARGVPATSTLAPLVRPRPGPGRPGRRPLGPRLLVVSCLVTVGVLGMLVRHGTQPIVFDQGAQWLFDSSPVTRFMAWAHLPKHKPPTGVVRAFTLGLAPLIGAVEAAIAVLAWRRADRRALVICLAGPALAVGLVEIVLKPLVDRHHFGGLAFPSGHATAAAALATAAVIACRRWRGRTAAIRLAPVAAIVPVGVGLAVIRLGMHFPTDAVAGIAFGMAVVGSLAIALPTRAPAAARATPVTAGGATIGEGGILDRDQAERPVRPLRRRPALLLGLVLAGWTAWAAANVAWAAVDAARAQRQAAAARRVATADPRSPAAVAGLISAGVTFDRANSHLGLATTWPLRALPVIGRNVAAFDAMSAGAARVATVSGAALTQAQDALRSSGAAGPERVAMLRRLAAVAGAAGESLATVDPGPGHLLAPLAGARDRFVRELDGLRSGLRRGAAGATAGADLLAGPRSYLVLAANNAEMRSGSGMFLAAGGLQSGDGNVRMTPFQATEAMQLPEGAVPLEPDLQARWGWLHPGEEWRNLGLSPRFDVTGPLAARMWKARTGETVDGVLAVDVVALKAILATVGPVELDGTVYDAATVEERVLHGQYVAHAADPDQGARREEMGSVARLALSALQERSWDASVLVKEVGAAARGRHILAWSARPAEQAGWVGAGIDGAVGPDSLLVGVSNRGANKLDRFLEIGTELRLDRVGGRTEAEMRIHLINHTPLGQPQYVSGPCCTTGVAEGTYLGVLTVTLPGDARNARFEGGGGLVVAGPDGPTRVVGEGVTVARGQQLTAVLRFELPGRRQSLVVEPSARVPPVLWAVGRTGWTDDRRHVVRW